MIYAIISDIHANLEALQKTLEIIEKSSVDEIICLGDIVGYGASPNECVDLVRKNCAATVLGNHDAAAIDISAADDFHASAKKAIEWTANQLTSVNKEFLSSLPLIVKKEEILFVHASPHSPELWDYILDPIEVKAALGFIQEKICFFGHTHIPGIYARHGKANTISSLDQFIVNVGSVGQPRDRNPMLAFGIFNSSSWSYELIRSAYSYQQAAEKIYKAGLPEDLGFRLMYGM
jgi:diadenosine tetraphosphatase ApaH/serine/threonine PP2A family protein phosphatase